MRTAQPALGLSAFAAVDKTVTSTAHGRLANGVWRLCNRFDLAALPSAPFWARRHAGTVLSAWIPAADLDTPRLLVSELVTNAVVACGRGTGRVAPDSPHEVDAAADERLAAGQAPTALVCLRLACDHRRLLIEVWDDDPSPPVLSPPVVDAEAGRGLLMVDALSTDWGYYWYVSDLRPPRRGSSVRKWPPRAGKVVWCTLAVDGLVASAG
jgi:hypothetical protein